MATSRYNIINSTALGIRPAPTQQLGPNSTMTPPDKAYQEDLLKDIEANRSIYIEFLQRFVGAASPNPPGDTRAASGVIQAFLYSHGNQPITIAPLAHVINVFATFNGEQGNGPRVLFNGHIDTFSLNDDTARLFPPCSGLNDGERIHGLGAVDMKAGTAASVIAFTILKKWSSHLTGSVALVAVSDEETGGRYGTQYLLESCGEPLKADCVINGAPGGLQSVRFGEKGTLRMMFTVTTEGANGAYTHRGVGAILVAMCLGTTLVTVVESIPVELPQWLREYLAKPAVRQVTDEIMGHGAADNMLKATVNIGTIHGGARTNLIPAKCVFEADIRLPIGLTRETVLEHIDELLKMFPRTEYVVQETASHPASFQSFRHPFARCIADAAEGVTGRRPTPLLGLGGTDCKFFRSRGMPAFVFGN